MRIRPRIALIGKSGSGKSEAACVLAEKLSYQHVRTGRICRQIANLLFGNEDKSSTQMLDDALTKIDDSIFLRASLRPVDQALPFVIDSLRFEADLALARSLNCFVIRIVANPDVRNLRLRLRGQEFHPSTDGNHRSETELDHASVDTTISNGGALADLHSRLISVATDGQ